MKILIAILFSFMITGCIQPSVKTVAEYQHWINDPDNGLVHTKEANGIRLTSKLLPGNYLAFKEAESGDNTTSHLEATNAYDSSITFLFQIAPIEEDGDIMYRGVGSYEDYKKRLTELSFFLEDRFELKVGANTYKPALASFENIYSLKPDRKLIVVFAPSVTNDVEFYSGTKIRLTFTDDVFDTGISHFTYHREDLRDLPKLNI